MEKIGIFYGSTTGNTQNIAEFIASKLGNCDVFDVSKASKEDLNNYKNLILASSTYGDGELQTDWDDFSSTLSEDDFVDKIVAIVGIGDQDAYSDTFCDAIGILATLASKATIIGVTKNDGYNFEASKSLDGDNFLGLALDEDNQSDLTTARLESWIKSIEGKFA